MAIIKNSRNLQGKSEKSDSTDESLDTLFQGRLAIIQRKRGYRFSLDAILLAHFVTVNTGERVIDLGTGNGVIPIMLASLYPTARLSGLEIQEEMAERALRSVSLNRLGDSVGIVQGDVCSIKQIFLPQSFDAAVCNPPYRRATSGRINPNVERRVARHEIKGCLRDFLRAGSYLLRRRGRMSLVYPAARTVDLLQMMREEDIEPKRLRLVHSFERDTATLVLAEGIKGARSDIKIMPPLIIYTREKKYTAEVRAMLSGRQR